MERRKFLGVSLGLLAVAATQHPILSLMEDSPYKVDVLMLLEGGETFAFKQVPFKQDPTSIHGNYSLWRIPECKMETDKKIVVERILALVPARIWYPRDMTVKTVEFPMKHVPGYPFTIHPKDSITLQDLRVGVSV